MRSVDSRQKFSQEKRKGSGEVKAIQRKSKKDLSQKEDLVSKASSFSYPVLSTGLKSSSDSLLKVKKVRVRRREALPHQKNMLFYTAGRHKIALFAEMRLGKTLVAIRWVQSSNERPLRIPMCLVVAPLTVLEAWHQELLKESIQEKDIGFCSSKELNFYPWTLVNYERLRAQPEILSYHWSHILCDESTKIKNPTAQITRLLVNQSHHIPNKAILSGLPCPRSPMDYFSQFCFLRESFMGHDNYWSWRRSYFYQPSWSQYEWMPKKNTLDLLKQSIDMNSFVLTRKSAGVGSAKVYEKRYIPMSKPQATMYKKVEKEFEYEIKEREGQPIQTNWTPVKLLWMQRITGGFRPDETFLFDDKIQEVISLLKGELEEEKVVIWCRFNAEIEILKQILKRNSISCDSIMGETPIAERSKLIQEFQTQSLRVLIVQMKCCKYGVDLSSASTAIYYSNSYDLEDRAQSEDRILHPKKNEPLLYIDLVARQTVDEDVLTTLQDKSITAGVFMSHLFQNWYNRKEKEKESQNG